MFKGGVDDAQSPAASPRTDVRATQNRSPLHDAEIDPLLSGDRNLLATFGAVAQGFDLAGSECSNKLRLRFAPQRDKARKLK